MMYGVFTSNFYPFRKGFTFTYKISYSYIISTVTYLIPALCLCNIDPLHNSWWPLSLHCTVIFIWNAMVAKPDGKREHPRDSSLPNVAAPWHMLQKVNVTFVMIIPMKLDWGANAIYFTVSIACQRLSILLFFCGHFCSLQLVPIR